jgi:RNA polymerase sigma-70 factor (ECF subfamily)
MMQANPQALRDSADGREITALTRARASDAAFEALYVGLVQTYHAAIVRYIHGLVPVIQQAEDLAQDTFLKAYLALASGEPPDNPRAWLYRIATNTSLDYLRRRSRFSFVALHRLANVLRGRDNYADVESADPVGLAMDQLKADDRSVLLLFAEAGLKAPEVAEVLGITPAAARKRRQRAREAFTRAYHEAQA